PDGGDGALGAVRPVCAEVGTVERDLDDAASAGGCGERRLELLRARGGRVTHPVPGAQRGDVDVLRGAEDALEARGPLGCAVLERGEDRAAAVVEEDHLEVDVLLEGAAQQAAGVVEEREVA